MDKHRSGALLAPYASIRIEVWRYGYIRVEYFGPLDELLRSGVLTEALFEQWAVPHKGTSLRDANGDKFTMQRKPTRTLPSRVRVLRCIDDPANALLLPGIAALFPEGLTLYDYRNERQEEREQDDNAHQDGAGLRIGEFMREQKSYESRQTRANRQVRRSVGRKQRTVSWYTVEGLIVPDWSAIRVAVATAHNAHDAS